jgi:plasmid stabilization system protein ParE
VYQVVLTPFAIQDISETAFWYRDKKESLGKAFTQKIRESINIIKNNPKAFPIRYDEIRTALVETFPFMIPYLINDEENQILVLAVYHTSRNPLK